MFSTHDTPDTILKVLHYINIATLVVYETLTFFVYN